MPLYPNDPNIPNAYYRTSAKALILDDEKKFMLIREDIGLWEMPGGGIDFGETAHECIKREIKEETGLEVVEIEKRPIAFLTVQNINDQWKSCVFYLTKVKDFNIVLSDECQEMRFFTREEALREKLYPSVEEFLKNFDPEDCC